MLWPSSGYEYLQMEDKPFDRDPSAKEAGSRVNGDTTETQAMEHSGKLTWQWKIPIFNREYIFNSGPFSSQPG